MITPEEWAVYQKIDREFLIADIKNVAKENGVALTKKEVVAAADRFEKTESMEIDRRTTLENAIEWVKEK